MSRHYPQRPCSECPYIGRVPGWIGVYDDPQEFVDFVMREQEMPCHSAVNYDSEDWQVEQWDAPRCLGQLMFANRVCKRFRDPEVAAHQERVGKTEHGPAELVALHRQGMPGATPGEGEGGGRG